MGVGRMRRADKGRRVKTGWRLGTALILIVALLSGCASSMSSDMSNSKKGTDDVRVQQLELNQGYGNNWPEILNVDVLTPLPLPYTYRSLHEEHDEPRLTLLQSWLNDSIPVDGSFTSPLNDRSFGLRMMLANGEDVTIRPAWTCMRLDDVEGGIQSSIQCTAVEAHIAIQIGESPTFFTKSEPLFRLLDTPSLLKEWMPPSTEE